MTPLEVAQSLHEDGYVRCFCSEMYEYPRHEADCPVPSMPRIVAALTLIDQLGFTFEDGDDGLRVISRPQQRQVISERALRVMEAAGRMVEEIGEPVAPPGDFGTTEIPDRLYRPLVAALRGETEDA